MDHNRGRNAPQTQSAACQCRCPCHYKSNNDAFTNTHRQSDDSSGAANIVVGHVTPNQKTQKQSPQKPTVLSLEETYSLIASETDPSIPYNPFRVKDPPPAVGAAFSKSFLHAKNIVKNMKARWESLSEPLDDDGEGGSTKRYSLPGHGVNYDTNATGSWKREAIEIDGDGAGERILEWKYQVPENIEQHTYQLQPLQPKELSEENGDEDDFEWKEATEEDEEIVTGDFSKPEQAVQLHPTNPFKMAGLDRSGLEVEESITPPPQPPPRSVQSEVRNIRRSFEQEVGEIVANVQRRSLDEIGRHQTPVSIKLDESIKPPPQPPPRSIQSEVRNITKSFENEVGEIVTNVQRRSLDSNNISKYHHHRLSVPDTFKLRESARPPQQPPPRSVQSEVRNIRKSFENEVGEIVTNVQRRSLDSSNISKYHHHHRLSVPDTFKLRESARPPQQPPPRSVQSEVRNIRRSFEQEVGEIVANVQRRSLGESRPHHTTPFSFNVQESSKPPPQPPPTRFIQSESEVGNVRKEIENEIDEIVTNAQMISIDSQNPENNNTSVPFPAANRDGGDADAANRMERIRTALAVDHRWENADVTDRKSLGDNWPFSSRHESYHDDHDYEDNAKRRHSTPSSAQASHSQSRNFWLQRDSNGASGSGSAVNELGKVKTTTEVAIQTYQAPLPHPHLQNESSNAKEFPNSSIINTTENRKPPLDSANAKHNKISKAVQSTRDIAVAERHNNSPGRKFLGKSETTIVVTATSPPPSKVVGENKLFTEGKGDNESVQSSNDAVDQYQQNDASIPSASDSSRDGTKQYDGEESLLGKMANVAMEMHGHGKRQPEVESEPDDESILANLSKEYDQVIATPSTVHVDSIGHSISVTNASAKLHQGRKRSSAPVEATTSAVKSLKQDPNYSQMRSSNPTTRMEMHRRGKREFYMCHRCHKVVASGEAAFYYNGGYELAWHPYCFKCNVCEKDLSLLEHGFFDDEPYCMEHYKRVANVPKCFKCHELIFDTPYTSAGGNLWHRQHFACQSCKRPLVDTKYVIVQNEHPYCLHCHQANFPKHCKTCQQRISPEEPYVHTGGAFWHSNSSCLYCSSCNGSLVGRSIFFRKDERLYCNRYCAIRKM